MSSQMCRIAHMRSSFCFGDFADVTYTVGIVHRHMGNKDRVIEGLPVGFP